jgi:hypothetical protein
MKKNKKKKKKKEKERKNSVGIRMKKNGKITGQKEKKHKLKSLFHDVGSISTLYFALALYVLKAFFLPVDKSFDIKGDKVLKIFLLASGMLCTALGFLVGFSVIPMKHGELPQLIFILSLGSAIIFFHQFLLWTNLPKTSLLIITLVFVFNLNKVKEHQWISKTNDSLYVNGGVKIVARIIPTRSTTKFPHYTYEFKSNKNIFSRTQLQRGRKIKAGDTILIIYSINNPKLNYPIEFYPSVEQIEEYRHGVYFEWKKKEE